MFRLLSGTKQRRRCCVRAMSSALLHSPRKRQSLVYDEYGFALQKEAAEGYQIYCQNTADKELARMARYEDCLFDTERGFKDREYSQMVRTGIPRNRRRMEWLECCGLQFQIEKSHGYYDKLLAAIDEDPSLVEDRDRSVIDMDVKRIGDNCVVDTEDMAGAMRRVLWAYCADSEGVGYSQGMNFFVSGFLLLKFTEEECFHLLRYVCTILFPISFTPDVIGLQADCAVLKYYLSVKCRDFVKLMERHEITLDHFVLRFVGSLCFGVMPQESVYRVWDRMITGGAIEFFKSIIKIFNYVYERICRSYGERLGSMRSDFLIQLVDAELRALVNITDALIRSIPGKPIELYSFNKRRMKERRLHIKRGKTLQYAGRRDSFIKRKAPAKTEPISRQGSGSSTEEDSFTSDCPPSHAPPPRPKSSPFAMSFVPGALYGETDATTCSDDESAD